MATLTDLAIRKRSVAIAMVLLLIAAGTWAARNLTTELLPNIQVPIATVMVVYPGADPQSVLDQVTVPVESAIGGMPRLHSLRSFAESSLSVTIVEFEYGTNMKDALATINQNLTSVQLPSTAQLPKVGDFDLNALPIMRLSLTSDFDPQQLGDIAENTIKPRLESIDGVRSVEVVGKSAKQVVVSLDSDKMAEAKIDVSQVSGILQASNVQMPSGDIVENNLSVPIRAGYRITSTQQIEDLVIRPAVPSAPSGIPGATGMAGLTMGGSSIPAAATPSTGSSRQTGMEGRTYVVQAGDTLWAIATREYGDGSASKVIFEANRDKLTSPNMIHPGVELRIPKLENGTQAPSPALPSAVPPTNAPQATQEALHIRDLATVELVEADNAAISRTNGHPSIGLLIYRTPSANTVRVAAAVRQSMNNLQSELRQIQITTIEDQSEQIQDSIDDLTREAMLGAFFAVLIIFIFLLSVRTTLAAAASIPLSMLITLILLNVNGMSLNMMTLGGMTVAVGRVVDDTVVVLENNYRHMRRGEGLFESIRSGAGEVAFAITSSTLTTVGVFLPLAFVGGLVGEVFRPFALTASFALAASLLVALTAIPAIATFLSSNSSSQLKKDTLLQRLYTPLIQWSLRRRRLSIGLAVFVLLASLAALPFIGTSFLPSSNEKSLEVRVELPAGTNQEGTLALASEVERVISDLGDVEVQQTNIGNSGSLLSSTGFSAGNSSTADIFVKLDQTSNVEQDANRLREQLNALGSAATFTVSALDASGTGASSVEIAIIGGEYQKIQRAADDVIRAIKNVDGLDNLQSEAGTAKPEISVVVDPEKAIQHGTTAAQVAMKVRQMVVGQTATTFNLNDQPTDVLVRVRPEDANSVEKLKKLSVGTMEAVTLADIAEVRVTDGPIRLTRRNQESAVTITAAITKDNTGAVNQDIKKAIDSLDLPQGVSVEFGGVMEEQTQGFASLGLALVAAVALVYLIMMATMGSLLDPLVILVTLPLASIGAVLSLLITGRSLGIAALIGMLMLIGIVVTNAIVLLDLVRRLRAQGMGIEEALIEAGRTRVRPILMTAAATVLALVPSASGINQGSMIATEMATVVIGGLSTSTLLTLIVVPVVYRMTHHEQTGNGKLA